MFHLREGVYFQRVGSGSVRIVIRASAQTNAPIVKELTVPENEWASVLATVCARGETAESWQDARDYHQALP